MVIVVTKTKLHPGGCLLPDGGCALVYSVAGTNLVVVAAALTFLHATPARLSPEETQLQLLPALGQPWTKRAVGLFAALFIALVAAWLCAACTADGEFCFVAVAVLVWEGWGSWCWRRGLVGVGWRAGRGRGAWVGVAEGATDSCGAPHVISVGFLLLRAGRTWEHQFFPLPAPLPAVSLRLPPTHPPSLWCLCRQRARERRCRSAERPCHGSERHAGGRYNIVSNSCGGREHLIKSFLRCACVRAC